MKHLLPPEGSDAWLRKTSRAALALPRVGKKAECLVAELAATAVLTSVVSRYSSGFSLIVKWIGGFLAPILFLLGFITIFRKNWAPLTAPVLALLAGIFMTAYPLDPWDQYSDLVLPVLGMVFGPAFMILPACIWGTVTEQRTKWGTLSIVSWFFVGYVVSLYVGFLALKMSFMDILDFVTLLVVAILPAVILGLQFSAIKKKAENGAPKFSEWCAALSLLVIPLLFALFLLSLFYKPSIPFQGMETY